LDIVSRRREFRQGEFLIWHLLDSLPAAFAVSDGNPADAKSKSPLPEIQPAADDIQSGIGVETALCEP